MWPLRWFHYDEGIDSAEVYLLDGPGEAELVSRDEALAIARGRGLHLIPEWPEHLTTGQAWCRIGKVSPPLRWEHVPEPEQAEGPDPLLWFEAPCGGRDLVPGQEGQLQRLPSRNGPDVAAGQVLRSRVRRREPAWPASAARPRRQRRTWRPDRLEGRYRQVPPHRPVARQMAHLPDLRLRPPPRHRRRGLPGASPGH